MPETRSAQTAPQHPRRRSIREAFNRAAETYDQAAHIQREICSLLASFGAEHGAAQHDMPGNWVLDAGCGTGFGLHALDTLCPQASRIGVDLAPAMLERARQRARTAPAFIPVCADLEHLPLADNSITLLWSSLAMQWCQPAAVLVEVARVLTPGGCALIATLGPQTLWELRAAFTALDDARHTIDFHPCVHWTAAAQAAGLCVSAAQNRALHACAPDLRGLLRDIKAIGAATVDGERRRKPLGRQAWGLLQTGYEQHRRSDGLLPATYDLILLALHKPG
jgi:malonyl-CoA O-methyltransferase